MRKISFFCLLFLIIHGAAFAESFECTDYYNTGIKFSAGYVRVGQGVSGTFDLKSTTVLNGDISGTFMSEYPDEVALIELQNQDCSQLQELGYCTSTTGFV
jgi:hypothetical protein